MRRFLIALIALTPLIAHAAHVPEHTAGKVTDCSVGLSWDANVEPDMFGYNLYLGRSSSVYNPPVGVPHEQVSRIVVPCADAGVVDEGQYFFTVEAVDQSGNVSPKAAEFSFFVDRPPATPGGLDAN